MAKVLVKESLYKVHRVDEDASNRASFKSFMCLALVFVMLFAVVGIDYNKEVLLEQMAEATYETILLSIMCSISVFAVLFMVFESVGRSAGKITKVEVQLNRTIYKSGAFIETSKAYELVNFDERTRMVLLRRLGTEDHKEIHYRELDDFMVEEKTALKESVL